MGVGAILKERLEGVSMVAPDQGMPLSQVALVISIESSEGEDYLKMRDELFEGETVESLVEEIRVFRGQSDEG